MKLFLFAVLAAASLAQASPSEALAAELNVNSRYTVESIDFKRPRHFRLSSSTLKEMRRLIGQRLNTDALERLASRITHELHARQVTFNVARGDEPQHVKVLLEVDKHAPDVEVSIPSFYYHSREGWSGGGQIATKFGDNALTFRAISNGDDLVERYSGVRIRYDRLSLGTDRIHFGFEFDEFREDYNRASSVAFSLQSAESLASSSLGAGAYRSRRNYEPSATFVLARPLTLTVGLSFENIDPQLPAARSESANAVFNTLRYYKRWEDSDHNRHLLDAGYTLRAATRSLGSDSAYTRHSVNVRYAFQHERQSIEADVLAGVMHGRAPLFERFVLGNSSTLRGWNKYDLDPLGGNRMAYASVTYGYRCMRFFYDTGSVWDRGERAEIKQSAGVGVTSGLHLFKKDTLLLAVAFPIRQGRMDPVFIAGMNF